MSRLGLSATACCMAILSAFVGSARAQATLDNNFAWLRHARVFLLDAYTYPLYPNIEFDAERLAATMQEMHADTLRVATSGHYWLVPDTPFSTAPGLGNRDILAECIKACKRRGIRVVPYVRAGGSAAAEIVKPEWAYRADPQGTIPVEWDLGCRMSTFCWNTSYRQAFYELVEKIASYDIDAIYFDSWKLCYGFEERVCYCDGCRRGFHDACGLQLPYREDPSQYSASERETIARYHDWYRQRMVEVFREVKQRIRARKNIPLVFNLNHVSKIRDTSFTDPRIVEESDAFLYEMSDTMLERAEGISLAVAHGLAVWPYVDVYHGYPRINIYGEGHPQNIYATVAFGGSPVLYHTYFFVDHPEARAGSARPSASCAKTVNTSKDLCRSPFARSCGTTATLRARVERLALVPRCAALHLRRLCGVSGPPRAGYLVSPGGSRPTRVAGEVQGALSRRRLLP